MADLFEDIPTTRKRKASAGVKKVVKKRKKNGPRKQTPLQRFRIQTVQKRKDLKAAKKDIDRQLRAIEKDLGVLKRKKNVG